MERIKSLIHFLNKTKEGWIPLLFVALATPWLSDLDLNLARIFYTENQFQSTPFYFFIYHYAIYPAWLVVAGSTILFFLSYFFQRCRPLRKASAYLVLTLLIGSGIFVHLAFKDHWGRPRPRQVIEFGGHQSFRPYYQPNLWNQSEPSKSFPCGHCTMGFYFFAFIFLGRRIHSRTLVYLGWLLSLGLGIAFGITRMAQGGHFFSDVIFSGLMMWWTAWGLNLILWNSTDERSYI